MVYSVAVPLIPKLLKIATPEEAVAVVVPTNVPPGLIVAVTTADEFVTVLPFTSRIVTCGWVVNAVPYAVPMDSRDRKTWVGTSGVVTVKVPEVAAVSAAGVNVSVWFPLPVITRLVKFATPATALTAVVPLKVPDPDAIEATTLTVEEVTVLPEASVILTTG